MAQNNSLLWQAAPHTIAKIEILKGYLNAWFPIVGSKFKKLVYIDGFAGPGSYENHPEGSPLAALDVFNSWITKKPERIVVEDISCFFIESDRNTLDYLAEKLSQMSLAKRIHPKPCHGDFETVFGELIQMPSIADNVTGALPLLIFADPFGGTGVPFHLFQRCLESQGSELLLNFDADGIARIHFGKNPGWEKQLNEVFGCDEWQTALEPHNDSLARKSEKALALYKQKLLAIDGVKFVWSFEMRGKTDRLNYYLVFASRNRLGMEKMKEAMRSIDGSGNYCFSDAYRDHHILFKNDDAEFFAKIMHEKYLGQNVTYADLDIYALCETPFINPKGMLDWLSRSHLIRVQAKPGCAPRAHSFPEEQIDYVTFLNPPKREVQRELF
ncbi:three-Cys-motif partner protein TcmP [Luteolibacter sp. GHJ8]|uniref:Three-Cys-motif partner protein TcmP n=1 Tax=Luteolibacter rhizosphaerae TaxID=2989719 RepID=A0ABT3G571_9BACT|nr:three-Cys-motif partner protein TcmP [Luteolibacter rhizosphaerae]MCW1914983.1 three-Cys-motif partner protein TcmP [Luteolibacter rhizosphaerae]